LKIGAGPTPHIQNSRPLLPEIAADLLDKLGDDPPPARKPPVFALDLIHDRVGVLFHLARERIANVVGSGGHKLLRGFAPDVR
jgi:hypothetical protein